MICSRFLALSDFHSVEEESCRPEIGVPLFNGNGWVNTSLIQSDSCDRSLGTLFKFDILREDFFNW